MVPVRVQSLYSMASSSAHDYFCQEAISFSLLCVLMQNHGRDVTRSSHTSRLSPGSIRDLLIKNWFWHPYSVFFLTFGKRGVWGLIWAFVLVTRALLTIKLCEECGSSPCVRVFLFPWGHVVFMTIYGPCDVTFVTWPKCAILIGRDNFCCALIG